jgi:ribosomal protein L37AE/L43A
MAAVVTPSLVPSADPAMCPVCGSMNARSDPSSSVRICRTCGAAYETIQLPS